MANRTIRTPEKDRRFLERLSRGASVAAAAKAAGYGRQQLYEWREADPELGAAWQAGALYKENHRAAVVLRLCNWSSPDSNPPASPPLSPPPTSHLSH
jgi:transposase-like protein